MYQIYIENNKNILKTLLQLKEDMHSFEIFFIGGSSPFSKATLLLSIPVPSTSIHVSSTVFEEF